MSHESTVPKRISPRRACWRSPSRESKQVLDLGAGEIRVQQQAGLGAEDGLAAVGLQPLADRGADAALPDDGVGDRPAGVAVPEDGRFALVGDAQGGDVRGRKPRGGHRLAGHVELAGPDRLRVVLDQAGAGQDLRELLLGLGHRPAVAAEDDRPARGGALVECEDELVIAREPGRSRMNAADRAHAMMKKVEGLRSRLTRRERRAYYPACGGKGRKRPTQTR